MTKEKKSVLINKEYCKACGFCIKFCQENALAYTDEFNKKGFHPVIWNGECNYCGKCYIICPDGAIEIK